MKARPDLDSHNFIGGGQPDTVHTDLGSDRIVQIPLDKLRPNTHQSRGDNHWIKPEVIEYLGRLAESMRIELPGGGLYGVRRPLEVRPLGEDGLHEIIAGENRWRAAQLAGLEAAPARINAGSETESRLDHVTENALRSDLTLWQTAQAIVKDQEMFGFDTNKIIAAHGLRNKSHLSKIMSVLKLDDEARALVESGKVDNVEYAYELKKLNADQVKKLTKALEKGTPVSQALKTITKPKSERPVKEPNAAGQGGSSSGADAVLLSLTVDNAKALALKLDVEAADDVMTLQIALQNRINALV